MQHDNFCDDDDDDDMRGSIGTPVVNLAVVFRAGGLIDTATIDNKLTQLEVRMRGTALGTRGLPAAT